MLTGLLAASKAFITELSELPHRKRHQNFILLLLFQTDRVSLLRWFHDTPRW